MENVGIFYDHLAWFMVIYFVLWPFGIMWHFVYICRELHSDNKCLGGLHRHPNPVPDTVFNNRMFVSIHVCLIFVPSEVEGHSFSKSAEWNIRFCI
jgi:hypothetical protein